MSEHEVTITIHGAKEFWGENDWENTCRFTDILDKHTAAFTGEPYTPFIAFENHGGQHELAVTFDITAEDRTAALVAASGIMAAALIEFGEGS